MIGKNTLIGVLVVNNYGEVISANQRSNYLLNLSPTSKKINDILQESTIVDVINKKKSVDLKYDPVKNMYLLEIPDEEVGIVLLFDAGPSGYNFNLLQDDSMVTELEGLMSLSGEIVTITNAKGKVLRVSSACERMLGIKENDYIGEYIENLYNKGIFDTSTTEKVVKEKKEIVVTQETKAGRRFVLRSHPIFDSNEKVRRVIHIGQDVTKENKLRKDLEETQRRINQLQIELNNINNVTEDMVIKSKVMTDLYNMITRVANVEATILILGESGVGKEVVAKKIHDMSDRYKEPFVKVNCGSIPESLIESELFGYTKGTFTGASSKGKIGLIKAAHKGTLFLDEIGELPLNLQVKLLQVLQDKQIIPLGGTTAENVDIRIVAATNRDLKNMVREGTFRKDLYYRLNVVPITIPPLRDRKEDIPFFVNYFLRLFNKKYNTEKKFDEKLIQLFSNKKWEGNVRELQNTVERIIVTSASNIIQINDLPDDILKDNEYFSIAPDSEKNLQEMLEDYEKYILQIELKKEKTLKNLSKRLSIDISTASRKLKKYNIDIV